MCGISGIALYQNLETKLAPLVHDLCERIKHRGPDDEGYYLERENLKLHSKGKDTEPALIGYEQMPAITDLYEEGFNLALGFRRLAIVEKSPAGHQPMQYANGKYTLVFNGEIYNFKDIKRQLKNDGYSFVTETDTEVILAAWQKYGPQMLNYLDGMWALALYDSETKVLFLSRDRLGVKPLYYYEGNNFIAFASELKALAEAEFYTKKVNKQVLRAYLEEGIIDSFTETLFEGIKQLPAGHNLTIDLKTGQSLQEPWYELPLQLLDEKFKKSVYEKHCSNVKEMLNKAVKLRLQADVPVANCLSGGIDSSSVVAISAELIKQNAAPALGKKQKTFTVSFPKFKFDERDKAELVSKTFDTEGHYIEPKLEGFLKEFEALVYAQDIPFFGASTYSQYAMFRYINQQGVKVTLDGQGADELFSGYNRHLVFQFNKLIGKGKIASAMGLWLKNAGLTFGLSSLFRDRDTVRKYDNLNKMLGTELTGHHLQVLLRTGDRNSMAFGVESRMPFSDSRPLIEYVCQIPAVYKMQGNRTKALLREAMKTLVPKKILNRRDKIGFNTPTEKWLKQTLPEMKQYFTGPVNNYILAEKLYAKMLKGKVKPALAWRYLNFAVWCKVYKVS